MKEEEKEATLVFDMTFAAVVNPLLVFLMVSKCQKGKKHIFIMIF
jgi:hypothetical protein